MLKWFLDWFFSPESHKFDQYDEDLPQRAWLE